MKGEVPCYDDASTVRRKLNKLLAEKATIRGTRKAWNKTSMAAEMEGLEKRGPPVEYSGNFIGPSVSSLGTFLKKSKSMGGGDSPCYYWGYVMLEKLRIYDGQRKTKTREQAEQEYVSRFLGSLLSLFYRFVCILSRPTARNLLIFVSIVYQRATNDETQASYVCGVGRIYQCLHIQSLPI